jgi:DNA polymerase-3 subunit epsilon
MKSLRRLLSRRHAPAEDQRWVVIDTETTGLDPAHDALLAIGGVAVDATGVRASDSFEAVLRHTGSADRHNIALHGIGREAQQAGMPAAEALAAFAEWSGGAPRIAFHAAFDRAVIERAAKLAHVRLAAASWLDIAPLAAALATDPTLQDGRATLDAWLSAYDIPCDARHNAAGDALATAELLLRLRAQAARQGIATLPRLAQLARQGKWLGAAR